MMHIVNDYWHPGQAGDAAVCGGSQRAGAAAPSTSTAATTATAPTVTNEGFAPAPGVMDAITGPTLVIWWSFTCVSCLINRGFFDRLEAAAHKQGYDVRRMLATEETLPHYPHVRTLPRYDVLTLKDGATSPYGNGIALQSIPNNDRRPLSLLFPTLSDDAQ